MNNEFKLDSAFNNQDYKIGELDLCYIYLNNNSLFPWVILIPKRNNIKEIIDLTMEDQHQLIEEINLISRLMKTTFSPDKLNIASFGNLVPQLHIHIIARFMKDKAWPKPTFNFEETPYSNSLLKKTKARLINNLTELNKKI